MKSILDQIIGRYYAYNGEDYLLEDKPLKYVQADNGSFEIRHTELGTFVNKVDKIPNLDNISEKILLDIPKIPFSIFNIMIAWFRKVYKEDSTEATFMIFYDKENEEFIPFIPEQENSGATSHYMRDEDKEYYQLSRNHILVMVAHSHPWNGSTRPGPSGTDNSDEKEAILYLIANNVKNTPNVYCSTCPGGKRINLDFFSIFENPFFNREDIPEDLIPLIEKSLTEDEVFERYLDVEAVEIPEEWTKKAKKKVVQTFKQASFDTKNRYDKSTYYGGYHRYNKTYSVKNDKMAKDIEDFYKEIEEDDLYGKIKKEYSSYDIDTFKESRDDEDVKVFDIIDQALDLDYQSKIDLISEILVETDEILAEQFLQMMALKEDEK